MEGQGEGGPGRPGGARGQGGPGGPGAGKPKAGVLAVFGSEGVPPHGSPQISGFSGWGPGGLQRVAQGLQGGGLLRARVLGFRVISSRGGSEDPCVNMGATLVA